SSTLPLRYMFSCFWEGQEGSFLLWTLWHVIIGLLLMRRKDEWRAPVLTTVSLVQVFLSSMLLGVYVFGYKVGSNPFLLLRHHPDMAGLPFLSNPDYLQHLDGRGLNPLLQNYWMTIHPPTLFLGFALTVVPFSFAIAGLWTGRYKEWIKPALSWTVLGVMVLGTGILMGGAWAYEALSFGGFWAWDPVENASLVPWLTLVGALHLMLIFNARKRSLFTTYLFTFITFFLILYSTFLTRSGILGDASVHAFTDLGMSGQLLVYLGFFTLLSIILLITRYKHIKDPDKEEDSLWSREFWMFVGALILLISCFQISFTTSIPVINKVFGLDMAPPGNPVEHYNAWQVSFASLIAALMGISQFLKYKHTEFKQWVKRILPALLISLVVGIGSSWALNMFQGPYIALMCASVFAVIANLDYGFLVLKGGLDHKAASVAHLGFGLILVGALISNATQQVISQNSSAYDLEQIAEGLPNRENIMMVQGDTLRMGGYHITYSGKHKDGVNIYYTIRYLNKDQDGNYSEAFQLEPLIQLNKQMGNVAEPDTRHFLTRDIYTHIQYADLTEFTKPEETFEEPRMDTMQFGDTLFAQHAIITLDTVSRDIDTTRYKGSANAKGAMLMFTATDIDGHRHPIQPMILLDDGNIQFVPDEVESLGIELFVQSILPDSERFVVVIKEKKKAASDFIIMKAIVFPFINILWLGAVLLVAGTAMAIRKRMRKA
ncbi:MAG: cytochrome c biogenesis protein CcsA, partial [Flavobacteriales bacterium]|nr:cytochrome c biogenesis protein CcsA [Flavobacteriales bacterium]